MKNKHNGEISIGRSQNAVHIQIQDDTSRTLCIEIDISLADFGKVVTGGSSKCIFVLRPDKVGWQHEHKTENVPFDHYKYESLERFEAAAKQALAPFEVDGWNGDLEDLSNMHCRSKTKPTTYCVRFVRWLPPKTK